MPPPRPAPSPCAFVTDVLRALAANTPPDLAHAPDATRALIVALHVLFPGELLPALDLLDRALVMRFVVADGGEVGVSTATSTATSTVRGGGDGSGTRTSVAAAGHDADPVPPVEPPTATTHPTTSPPLFYVRSAQPRRSRFASSVDSRAAYQVRLGAWNCTCPAFAFAAFPAESEPKADADADADAKADGDQVRRETEGDDDGLPATQTPQGQPWTFGGHARPPAHRMPPTCKHLLACALAEHCGAAFKCVEQRVSADEAAGWAAGWEDC